MSQVFVAGEKDTMSVMNVQRRDEARNRTQSMINNELISAQALRWVPVV